MLTTTHACNVLLTSCCRDVGGFLAQMQNSTEHTGRIKEQDAQIMGQTQTLRELHRMVLYQDQIIQGFANNLNSANTTPQAQPFPGPVSPPRSPAVTSLSEFRPSLPEKFSGNISDCKGFLFQCRLIFQNSPGSFPTDFKKISFILSQLTGRALEWAQARFSSDESLSCRCSDFISEFSHVFNQETDQTVDSRALLKLRQGNSSVAEFSINFRVKAAASSWNQCALKTAFFEALNENIKDELATLDEPATLKELIRLTIRLDNRIRARNKPFSMPRSKIQSLPLPVQASHAVEVEAEPMQIGHTRLTPEERLRRVRSKLCIYCGESGHFIASCPAKSKAGKSPRLLLPATLFFADQNLTLSAFIDSGCERNLIDSGVVEQLQIETVPLTQPLCVSAIDGKKLHQVTHQTQPLKLLVSGNHRETLSFFVFPSACSPLVLGFEWLQRHNPHINWTDRHIESWSTSCHETCLRSAAPAVRSPRGGGEMDSPDLTSVPPEYHDMAPVFSKVSATSLPPHRPYDCAIELLPGAPLPGSRLYSISKPERETMEKYINESLAAGIIRPSSSPLGAGFFFVGKKDGSLRPCIDYRGLNQITVKNKYPLPLLASAFEPVQGATVFTKLDLRNAYHLLRIRDGPVPVFIRWNIHNFSAAEH
uniref:CCHC-type domain-containing protein n=1 Tax=Cyprinodon variegatus TaxID=28743 RepID=A0A3Q2CFY6_CYPVA